MIPAAVGVVLVKKKQTKKNQPTTTKKTPTKTKVATSFFVLLSSFSVREIYFVLLYHSALTMISLGLKMPMG